MFVRSSALSFRTKLGPISQGFPGIQKLLPQSRFPTSPILLPLGSANRLSNVALYSRANTKDRRLFRFPLWPMPGTALVLFFRMRNRPVEESSIRIQNN